MSAPSYTCPRCYQTSHNPSDAANLYCGSCHLFADQLRDEVVTEFDHLLQAYKGKLTRRDCFSLAILTLMESADNPEARLVHGLVRDSFAERIIQHAWCEFPARAEWSDGTCTDTVVVVDYSQLDERARVRPREEIYEAMGVIEVRRYTREQALREALAAGGKDGPWESSPGGLNHV